jgi:cytoskeletal protein CcmA (bactofilin family)
MFSDKKEKVEIEPSTGQNRINEGTTIKGDIHSKGYFRIDGNIEGNVSTPSKVVLGKAGLIKGTLTCENADIEGKFIGNLDVTGTLSLKSTAHIEGDVVVGKLSVEPGATFNASCAMKGAVKQENKAATSPGKDEGTGKNQNYPFDRAQRIQKPKTEQPN